MQENIAMVLLLIFCFSIIMTPILISFHQVPDHIKQDIKRLRKTASSAFKAMSAKEQSALKEVYKKDFTGAETVTFEGVYKKQTFRTWGAAYSSSVTKYIDQYEIIGLAYMTSDLSPGDTFKVRGAFLKGRLYLLEVRKPIHNLEGVGICDFIKKSRISIVDDLEQINNFK